MAKLLSPYLMPRVVRFVSGNGQMDFGEFVKLMVAKNQFSFNEDEALEAFRIFDRDDRGYIMSTELRSIFQHPFHMQSPPPHGGQRNCLLYTGGRRAGFHCEKTSVTNAEFSRFCLMKPSSLVAFRRPMLLWATMCTALGLWNRAMLSWMWRCQIKISQ